MKKILSFTTVAFVLGVGLFSLQSFSGDSAQASTSVGTHKAPSFVPNELIVVLEENYTNTLLPQGSMHMNSDDYTAYTYGVKDTIANRLQAKLGDDATVETEILFDTQNVKVSTEHELRMNRIQSKSPAFTTNSLANQKRVVFAHISSPNKSTNELMDLIADDPSVQFTQPNYIYSVPKINSNEENTPQAENTENATFLWNIFNNASGGGLDADLVWNRGFTGKGVTVAVVDTGVDTDHPDLVDNIWLNAGETNCEDGIDNDSNGHIDDCNGWDFGDEDNDPNGIIFHGTHVAGIIGAKKDDSGVVGVAPDATIMPLKVFPDNGFAETIDVVNAIEYAWQNGADVISVSMGREDACSTIESQAIQAALEAGVLVVTSSGNADPGNGLIIPFSNAPAVCNQSFAIGATDNLKQVPDYSNYFEDMVDAIAPGGSSENPIVSTTVDGGYLGSSGTSMATPHVSGIAALLFEKNPIYTPQELMTAMCDGSDDMGEEGVDTVHGCGFLNANSIFVNTEGSAPVIMDGTWSINPIQQDPWSSEVVFGICDPDNDLSEGGDIRIWNAGTEVLLLGEAVAWENLPLDVTDCQNPYLYGVPVYFTGAPFGEYCVDVNVTDASGNISNTLQNLCVDVSDGTQSPLDISPSVQNVKIGDSLQEIVAIGGDEYSFQLISGTTGITKQDCSNGTAGTCQLSSPTGAGVASLVITSRGYSMSSVIHVDEEETVGGPFSVAVTADRQYPAQGETVNFTVHYENTGTQDYTSVRLLDSYNSNLLEITNIPENCDVNSSTIECAIGALLQGESGTIQFAAIVR